MSQDAPEDPSEKVSESYLLGAQKMEKYPQSQDVPFPAEYRTKWQEAPELQIEGATEQGSYPDSSEISAAVRQERDLHISVRMEAYRGFQAEKAKWEKEKNEMARKLALATNLDNSSLLPKYVESNAHMAHIFRRLIMLDSLGPIPRHIIQDECKRGLTISNITP